MCPSSLATDSAEHPLVMLTVFAAALGHPPSGDTQMLMIIHTGHTGTHALCEALGKLSCVKAACDEPSWSEGGMASFVRGAHGKKFAVRMYRSDPVNNLGSLQSWISANRIFFFPHGAPPSCCLLTTRHSAPALAARSSPRPDALERVALLQARRRELLVGG